MALTHNSAYSLLIQDGNHVDEGHNCSQPQAGRAGVPAGKTQCIGQWASPALGSLPACWVLQPNEPSQGNPFLSQAFCLG